jgi:hypothetical protein
MLVTSVKSRVERNKRMRSALREYNVLRYIRYGTLPRLSPSFFPQWLLLGDYMQDKEKNNVKRLTYLLSRSPCVALHLVTDQ